MADGTYKIKARKGQDDFHGMMEIITAGIFVELLVGWQSIP